MDKLIKYLDFRSRKYGVIKGIASANSMYYQIGAYKVRVSDHLKYGEDGIKDSDFFFDIQPNDFYIHYKSPKFKTDNRIYQHIVTYQEAKEIIKSIEMLAKFDTPYIPNDWNKGGTPWDGKLSWDEFNKKYLDGTTDSHKFSVISKIENIVFGNVQKGNLQIKLPRIVVPYENMTMTQYNTLMSKMEV